MSHARLAANHHPLLRALLVALVVGLVASTIFAQVDKGAIEAVATDESGGIIPGVTVTVVRPETGYQTVGLTNELGVARFPILSPGTYPVTFDLQGFAPVAIEDVKLRVGQTVKPNAALLPSASETITVTSEAPVVDVYKSDVSTNIVPEQIQQLPVADRDFQAAGLHRAGRPA